MSRSCQQHIPQELQAVLAATVPPLLLDVREYPEYTAGHIKGARLIPLGEIERCAGELPKNRLIVSMCRTGRRSAEAAATLGTEKQRMIFAHRLIRLSVHAVCLMIGVSVLLPIGGAQAQTLEEHASHHPGAVPAAGALAAGGGMMDGMGEMMKGMMGNTPPKELYPTLMALPELTSEKRLEVEQLANERMHTGTVLMGQALDSLNASTQSGDYATMHQAATRMREGIAQLESGIAARRALAEGRVPREVALAWFKQEMGLGSLEV